MMMKGLGFVVIFASLLNVTPGMANYPPYKLLKIRVQLRCKVIVFQLLMIIWILRQEFIFKEIKLQVA